MSTQDKQYINITSVLFKDFYKNLFIHTAILWFSLANHSKRIADFVKQNSYDGPVVVSKENGYGPGTSETITSMKKMVAFTHNQELYTLVRTVRNLIINEWMKIALIVKNFYGHQTKITGEFSWDKFEFQNILLAVLNDCNNVAKNVNEVIMNYHLAMYHMEQDDITRPFGGYSDNVKSSLMQVSQGLNTLWEKLIRIYDYTLANFTIDENFDMRYMSRCEVKDVNACPSFLYKLGRNMIDRRVKSVQIACKGNIEEEVCGNPHCVYHFPPQQETPFACC